VDPYAALSTEQFGVKSSHTIFMMCPCKLERFQYVSVRPVFNFATPHICNRIGEATVDPALRGAQQIYDFLLRQAKTKTSAGWISRPACT